MYKSDSGTNLGTNHSGVWDKYEEALENAEQVQLNFDLPKDISKIRYWSNYAQFALKLIKDK